MTRISSAEAGMEDHSIQGEPPDLGTTRHKADPAHGGHTREMTEAPGSGGAETSPGRNERKEKKLTLAEAGEDEHIQWPALTVETATPSPHPQTPDINNNDDDGGSNGRRKDVLSVLQEEGELEDKNEEVDELSEDGGEEEEVEEEEEDPEMTAEEKKDMYECVKSGDIDSLEDCLDLPNADINMTWFKENLLMTAIRCGQQEMAEFLLDNGVDHTYTTSVVAMREINKGKVLEHYQLNCRQMAYDKEMFDIVDLIDSLQGKLFPFIRLPERTPRLRRPRPPTPSVAESTSSSSDGADVSSSEGPEEEEHGEQTPEDHEKRRRLKKKMQKKKKAVSGSDGLDANARKASGVDGEDVDGDKNKTLGAGSTADLDSGHHSLGSGKLKMAMLREHDRLMEKEEREEERERLEASHKGSSPGRQGAAKGEALSAGGSKEKSGSVKSRAQSGVKSDAVEDDEREASGEHNRTHDEGYGGSVSLNSVTPEQISPMLKPPEPVRPWDASPKNRIRSTKSALASRKPLSLQYKRRVMSGGTHNPPGFDEAGFSSALRLNLAELEDDDISNLPLRWRKVSTTGSYARESKQWHRARAEVEKDLLSPRTTVEISEINLSSSNNDLHNNTALLSNPPISSVNSANHKLTRSILKSAASASTLSTPPKRPELTQSADTMTTSQNNKAPGLPLASRAGPTSNKPRLAGYMRATKSTSIKCRLSPRFACSYGALDFQAKNGHAKPRNEGVAKLTGVLVQGPAGAATSSTLPSSSRTEKGMLLAAAAAPKVTKSYAIPVLATSVREHQKRNQNVISFRS